MAESQDQLLRLYVRREIFIYIRLTHNCSYSDRIERKRKKSSYLISQCGQKIKIGQS